MESICSPSSAGTWSPTPALPAAAALEGERPAQMCPRPALSSPVWQQKEARAEPSASPALPRSTAHHQVRGCLQPDAEASGEQRGEAISGPRRTSLLCLLFLPPGRSSSKPTHACQATGVQVIRVPFSAHLAPFRQNQGFHLWKAVSSALLAPTAAQRLSRGAVQMPLQSPAELNSRALQVRLLAFPSFPPLPHPPHCFP